MEYPPLHPPQLRQHVSSRLRDSTKKETTSTTPSTKTGGVAALAAAVTSKHKREVAGGSDTDSGPDENDQLFEGDLVEACNRLENENLGFRQRLAKKELETLRKEHDDCDTELNDGSRLAAVINYCIVLLSVSNLCDRPRRVLCSRPFLSRSLFSAYDLWQLV